jgi:hypothetical protein
MDDGIVSYLLQEQFIVNSCNSSTYLVWAAAYFACVQQIDLTIVLVYAAD